MGKVRSWTDPELVIAVKTSKSYRKVLLSLHLVPAGGNYAQIQKRVEELGLSTEHFLGKGWNAGNVYHLRARASLDDLLVRGSRAQSFKLKKRLYESGLKQPKCELCGWSEIATDGRIPVELDHINGDHYDNRIENLRILCPNCHSLQPTHRGRNKKVRLIKFKN